MNATEINEKLKESLEKQIKVYPCKNLRASNLGHPCERYLYLLIKHWDERKPHDAGLQSIFNLGNKIEEFTIENLKKAGYEVITPTERSWKIDKPFITGREDIRIKDEKGFLLPVEIKGLSPIEFDKLNSIQDFFNSKKSYIRSYPAQLMIYLYYFEKEKGFFALTNKLTGQTKMIEAHLDFDYTEQLLQKAERIYKAIEENKEPEACEDCSVCQNCPLAHICGQMNRVSADIEFDGELEELIEKKNALKEKVNEIADIDLRIKQIVGDRENVITGKYQVLRKSIEKKEYVVPARTEVRLQVKKL